MARETGRRAVDWLTRWGFAFLVSCGAIVAAPVAWSVDLPDEIPSFALQAAPVYRLEVGAAVFLAVYLASMALVLALNNRAFSEIGMSGMKAHEISELQDLAIERQRQESRTLARAIEIARTEIFERDDGQR